MDTQHTLPHGTPEDVRAMVKDRMEALAPGGGFVYTTEHCIQSDVPFENLTAMIDAIREYGKY
jgi:uroporphyrinogen decarboxylase